MNFYWSALTPWPRTAHVRATQNLDIWVRPSAENAKPVIEALRAFGAPLHDLTEKDLSTPGLIFQIGVEPIRIDVLTATDGVQFDEAWAERVISKMADQPVTVLSREHLIKNKLAAARTQDLADVEALKRKSREQTKP